MLSTLLSLALIFAPVDDVDGPAADPMTSAQALYQAGVASYETFDYEEAIEKWTAAYALLPQTSETAATRNSLVYNIARAQEKAFAQDHDVARLRRAIALLERYHADALASGVADATELADVRTRIAELQAAVDAAQAEREPVRPAPTPGADADAERSRRGRAAIATGSVLMVLGVGAVVGGVVAGTRLSGSARRSLPGLDQLGDEQARADALAKGHRGDVVTIASAVAGGAVALAGTVLLAIGAKRRGRPASRSAFIPLPATRGAALTWTLAF